MRRILILTALILFFVSLSLGQEPPQAPGVATTPAPIYIVAGSGGSVTSNGQVWMGDTGLYNSGTMANCAMSETTGGTSDPILYKSARVGQTTAPMVYTFQNLVAGSYQVTLYMAECYFTVIGGRVFDVQFQNATVFSSVDIFKAVGKNMAYTLTASASVTGSTLTISFVPLAGHNVPIIDAIQIMPQSPSVHVAILTWTDNVNPIGSVKYNVYRASGNCAGTPAFAKIASNVQGLTYNDATVQAQQGYCYRITAVSVGATATESLPCTALYLPGSVTACTCQ